MRKEVKQLILTLLCGAFAAYLLGSVLIMSKEIRALEKRIEAMEEVIDVSRRDD